MDINKTGTIKKVKHQIELRIVTKLWKYKTSSCSQAYETSPLRRGLLILSHPHGIPRVQQNAFNQCSIAEYLREQSFASIMQQITLYTHHFAHARVKETIKQNVCTKVTLSWAKYSSICFPKRLTAQWVIRFFSFANLISKYIYLHALIFHPVKLRLNIFMYI